MKTVLLYFVFFVSSCIAVSAQNISEMLGRPTDSSVTLNVMIDSQADVYVEYGTAKGNYTNTTAVTGTVAGTPVEIKLSGLQPDTRYYYRSRFRKSGTTSYSTGAMHTFFTQRKKGSTFCFTIEADPHPYDKKGSWGLWPICLNNQLKDSADFMLDLGDTFGDDHYPTTITSEQMKKLHLSVRNFFDDVCHSMPLFFCMGNHEGESGYYLLQTPPENLAVYGSLWRKFYFSNPYPDGFYTGNNNEEAFGIGKPQNYYAWEWGDALFVVVDAYRYYTANAKPRGWDWTIGKEQYDWLKQTLETSSAKYKFVFTHHVLGETRGGVGVALLNEWGDAAKFEANRPGWGGLPIHQLMVKNNVNIFFQGHDHVYAYETLDNLVYQTTPMPSDSTYIIGIRDNGSAFTGKVIGGSGHLRVTVSPDSVKVDYVSALLPKDETETLRNGQDVLSYSVKNKTTSAVASVKANPNEWSIYPNPASEEIHLSLNNIRENNAVLSINAMDGRCLRRIALNDIQSQGNNLSINLNEGVNLSAGLYALSLSHGNSKSHKLLIVK